MVYGSIPYVGMAPKYMAVLVLYGNFCPAEKLVQWNQNFRNIGLCGPFFLKILALAVKITVRPAPQANSACCCLMRLIELDYYTVADSCN